MRERMGLRGVLMLLAVTGVILFGQTTEVRPRREQEKDGTQVREEDRLRPPVVKEESPSVRGPGLRPPQVKSEGTTAEQPSPEPRAIRRDGEPVTNAPVSVPEPIPWPPNPLPRAPQERQGSNPQNFGHDERGGYGRTFHGEHDRWRYNRFRGSWDFLIFPGPVIYTPPLEYGPNVITSHIAGVYVQYSGDDATGSSFATEVSDQLRQNDMGTVSAVNASLELYIISMDEDPSDPGHGSAVSVSYVLMPENRFITAQLLDVGTEQVSALAASVVSYAGQLLDEYR